MLKLRPPPHGATPIVLSSAVFFGVLALLHLGSIDLRLADGIYQWSGSTWSWRQAWLTRDLIHDGGRKLVGLMAMLLLVFNALAWSLPAGRIYRKGLAYLVVSTLSSALLVNVLKELTHVDCPWDLVRYGGTEAYASVFDFSSWSARSGACFPAGHASAGYAWFGLYYFAVEHRPSWRWPLLGAVVAMGFVFGTAQLLRGAHFASHDWWSAGLCWFVATGFYYLLYRRSTR